MRIFIAYSYGEADDLAAELRKILSGSGYDVFSPDTVNEPGKEIFAPITAAIQTADVVIALLTSPNPNVYFELGMAASSNVPTLVASDSPEHAVFDLAAAPYVELTGETALDAVAIARRVNQIASLKDKRPELHDPTLASVADGSTSLEDVSPTEFEHLVAQALEAIGYKVAPPTRRDVGFDLLIDGDPRTVVEIKRYRRPNLVPVGTVLQLLGAMNAAGASRAILVASSGFTRSARAAAAGWPVDLMTIDDLVEQAISGTADPSDLR